MRTHPPSTAAVDYRWARFRALLRGLKPGERVNVPEVAARTGVEADSVYTVLDGLTRASMFHRAGAKTFVRDSLCPTLNDHDK